MDTLLRMLDLDIAERVQPELKRYFERYKGELSKVKSYVRNGGGSKVKSSHVVLSSIYHLNSSTTDETIQSAYRRAKVSELDTAHGLGVSTSSKPGDTFDDEFFNCSTIVVLDRTNLNFSDFSKMMTNSGYREYSPVKVLRAPRTWEPLNLPNGRNGEESIDVGVISINIGMIGAMYYAWTKEQDKLPEDSTESIKDFVSFTMMPNMQESLFDACMQNVYLDILEEVDTDTDRYRGSTWADSYLYEVREELKELVSDINSQSAIGDRALLALPIDQDRVLNDIVPNLNDLSVVQNKWYEFLYMENLILIITLFCKLKKNKNTQYKVKAKRVFKRLFGNKVFRNTPRSFPYDVETFARRLDSKIQSE